jgi:hypothetical protein
MNYTLQLEPKSKIVNYVHLGILDKKDIGDVWQELLITYEFTEGGYNLLSDYRGSKFNLQEEDVDLICGFLGQLEKILRGKKQAIVIEDPLSTALTMLFESKINNQIGFDVRVFCTVEAAREWLIS